MEPSPNLKMKEILLLMAFGLGDEPKAPVLFSRDEVRGPMFDVCPLDMETRRNQNPRRMRLSRVG